MASLRTNNLTTPLEIDLAGCGYSTEILVRSRGLNVTDTGHGQRQPTLK